MKNVYGTSEDRVLYVGESQWASHTMMVLKSSPIMEDFEDREPAPKEKLYISADGKGEE